MAHDIPDRVSGLHTYTHVACGVGFLRSPHVLKPKYGEGMWTEYVRVASMYAVCIADYGRGNTCLVRSLEFTLRDGVTRA